MSLKLHCDVCDKGYATTINDGKPVIPDGWTHMVITHKNPPNPNVGYLHSVSEHLVCPDHSIMLGNKQIQQEAPF